MAGLPGSIPSQMPAGQDELVRRMRDLERRVDEMGPSVARSFGPVIADLAAKQAALTDLVANMIAPVTQNSWVTNFVVSNTISTYAPTSVTVPTGYTQAIVDLSVYFGAVNTLTEEYVYVAALINGVAGHEGIGGNNPSATLFSNAWSRQVSILTGLTAGSTITLAVQARTSDTGPWGANTSNRASTDAVVWFLR